jgi:serine/threonine protein kinase
LSGGGQGDIFLVTDTTGQYGGVWVQKLLRNKSRIGRFEREIKAGLELDHPKIIKVVDYDLEADRPYLVTEHCSGGSLADFDLSNLSVVDRLQLFAAVCRGVGYAHSQKPTIIHRDIKPDNIFLREDGTPVVGDFGICFIDEEGERLTLVDEAVGPRNFIAPELEDGHYQFVDPRSDVYSLGKLLYWLVSAKVIFAREKHRILKYDLTIASKDAGIRFIYDILDKTIEPDLRKRFKDANELENDVNEVIRRILMNAHPVDLTAPQLCAYCGIGFYQMRQASDDYERFIPAGGWRNTGMVVEGTKSYFILVCDHCGNVQMFRPDQTKNPHVWKKEGL